MVRLTLPSKNRNCSSEWRSIPVELRQLFRLPCFASCQAFGTKMNGKVSWHMKSKDVVPPWPCISNLAQIFVQMFLGLSHVEQNFTPKVSPRAGGSLSLQFHDAA